MKAATFMKAQGPPPRKWYVCYTSMGKKFYNGPYMAEDVLGHVDKLRGGYAVTNAFAAYVIPEGYEKVKK